MKIYTKTGDEGKTSLIGGARVPKSHDRVEAYGSVDELNTHVGLIRDQPVNAERQQLLLDIQNNLFVIGSLLAADAAHQSKLPALQKESVEALEQAIDQMQERLEPMRNFILPGGHPAVSYCHVARCVCRRAERSVVLLHEKEGVEHLILVYLNRLSDYLFVLSRAVAKELGIAENYWKGVKK